jgi:hypothetical protein
MKTLALLLLFLLTTPALAAPPVAGLARAKDGDSLMVGATEVRLFGVDASSPSGSHAPR